MERSCEMYYIVDDTTTTLQIMFYFSNYFFVYWLIFCHKIWIKIREKQDTDFEYLTIAKCVILNLLVEKNLRLYYVIICF